VSYRQHSGWAGAILLFAGAVLVTLCSGGIVAALSLGGRAIHRATTASEASMDQPARDGKFEFAVTGITCGRASESDDQVVARAARGQYCEVSLAVRNIGDRPQVFTGAWQRAKGSDGSTVGVDTRAAIYANSGDRGFIQQIEPGEWAQGLVVFDIPKGATIVALELHDSVLSAGVVVRVR
jgi:hypothetical protein